MIEKIILCTNNETIMQGQEDLPASLSDEIGEMVTDAACEALTRAGFDFETDSTFRNWHGYNGVAKLFGNLKVFGTPSEQEADNLWSINSDMDNMAQRLADDAR